ncbi:MAG TPA: TonB-dependent siderophore receptor [Albitalea sp.]|nr:TonB-dependent siderophore receptor [Albitalea sp.]
MAIPSSLLRVTPIGVASLLCIAQAHAQTTALERVTVTGKGDPAISVSGWGELPLSKSPFQASILSSEQIRDLGVQRLADIVRIDPSVSDAYNAEGYWDFLTVRGFVIDNQANYRRDGLPINAETSIPLDNKERVEILQGTSGLQAGVSAPGGLVNFVVKRPSEQPIRHAEIAWRQAGSVLGALDLSQRFGAGEAFGVRVNAAAEHIDPRARSAKGERNLLAVAGDWRLPNDMLLEAEFETSHRSQPSVPGFSMLGGTVPAASSIDPRINLNNQPWSLPVVLDATTASLRFSQRLSPSWRWTAHAATQQLTSDDRIAFPFGCSAENAYDRYCSDGSFDLYDFRSDNERRRTDALELALDGSLRTGTLTHELSTGVLFSRFRARFDKYAYNFVGTGNIQGTLVTPPDPTPAYDNTDRDERHNELFARDAIKLSASTTAWLGLRHTRLSRSSIDTAGVAGPSYDQSFTTPWLALSHVFGSNQLVYASWGQGVESYVTPKLPPYGAAAGQVLPAAKSRQVEFGLKGQATQASWNIAWFDIDRPVPTDTGSAFFLDGSAHHQGLVANGAWQRGRWTVQGGVQLLRARREGAQDASVNGLRPANVPARTLKLQARHDLAALPGLALQADLLAEGNRMVLPDNSARVPGYARVDAGLRYAQASSFGHLVWRAGVDNLLDRRAWRESPYQFGHVYLFPLAPRTLRLSVEASL